MTPLTIIEWCFAILGVILTGSIVIILLAACVALAISLIALREKKEGEQ